MSNDLPQEIDDYIDRPGFHICTWSQSCSAAPFKYTYFLTFWWCAGLYFVVQDAGQAGRLRWMDLEYCLGLMDSQTRPLCPCGSVWRLSFLELTGIECHLVMCTLDPEISIHLVIQSKTLPCNTFFVTHLLVMTSGGASTWILVCWTWASLD